MADTFDSVWQLIHQRSHKVFGCGVRVFMAFRFWYAIVLVPSSKPFFEHVGWSSVYLRIPWIEQMKALMRKLPPCAGWVSKGVWAQPNDNVSGPPLPIVRRNATIRKPDVRHIARRSVDVDAYQRKRTVSRSEPMLDISQELAGIFRERLWAVAAILPKPGGE